MSFIPIETEDKTVSLFNYEVNDVYHSKVGAYTEAVGKYFIPSGLAGFAEQVKSVKILDVCYGLGYNSKAAINEVLKINPDIKIHLTALEIDPVVLSFSTILSNECFDDDINLMFYDAIEKQIDIEKTIRNYLDSIAHISLENENKIPDMYKVIGYGDLEAKLHNIYYRSISARKSIDRKPPSGRLKADFLIKDARISVQKLTPAYDFIFLDPFTPSKTPALWTVDFFKILKDLLSENGNVTTYSNAAPVRAGFVEAGFYIGKTEPVGKKTPGTIAFKNSQPVANTLSGKELGLLRTKAGIPYRDVNLISPDEEILANWQIEKQNSDRVSSSSYLKLI